MNLEGRIKVIFDTQTFDSGFQKREFVITVPDGQYPQDIKLEFLKDKCDILSNYAVGDDVKVEFNLRGNEYQEKYYVNLQAWRMSKAEVPGENMPPLSDLPAAGSTENLVPDNSSSEEDDLPF